MSMRVGGSRSAPRTLLRLPPWPAISPASYALRSSAPTRASARNTTSVHWFCAVTVAWDGGWENDVQWGFRFIGTTVLSGTLPSSQAMTCLPQAFRAAFRSARNS